MLLLHISDIHFRSPDCLNPAIDPDRPYRTQLLRDIKSQVVELGAVNAILIGGDIAFKGAPDEYRTAMLWIEELAAVAGCPLERVFVVPGNHDVDRARILRSPSTQNAQAAILRASGEAREREFQRQIRDKATAQALLEPINAYNEFAKRLNCQVYLPDRLYWQQDLELEGGVSLRICGLTSILLSGVNGQNDTRDSLYLSPLQTVLDPEEDVVNLVLCHHPPDWFVDQDDVSDAVCGRAAIQMFGHKHRQRLQRDPQYIRFSAGAVNPERWDTGWQPGYNLVDVHVSGSGSNRHLIVNAHLRQWQTNPDRFRPILTQEDESVFRHVIKFPGENVSITPAKTRELGTPSASVSSPNPAPTEQPLVERAVETSGEAAMGDASTRNLVYRFWNLRSSERRDIAEYLELIREEEISLPEPERYGRALIRASKEGKLDLLAIEIAKREV